MFAEFFGLEVGIEQFVLINKLPVAKKPMKCTLAFDRRAVDGAVGAEML